MPLTEGIISLFKRYQFHQFREPSMFEYDDKSQLLLKRIFLLHIQNYFKVKYFYLNVLFLTPTNFRKKLD